ncbi:Lpg1974 family pore-forming outer membrane protein [Aeoliella sp. ICT_H6.2]|uniref:Lpg1974 family pore-forming outer membrane protein n=1 Tax=Aeoliella straminimaris TaxID=2954799 RepID=A0A9X2FDN3_9BACT|nr:Lpg1974 family pore-forming outer membrane protein [Aeoliella straminimaris]MCO6047162.1 Lpg1974 family pore-forming outer membrane protein [Aeoliella straminimaris]
MFARVLSLILLFACWSVASGEGVTPYAELLYWRPSAATSAVWASVVTEDEFEAKGVDFDWGAGYRAGLLLEPTGWLWDMNLEVTHFTTTAASDVPEGLHLVIPEFFSGFLSGDSFEFTSASLDWQLNYTVFDFEAGHTIPLGQAWELRPTFGLKSAVMNQHVQSEWVDPILGLTAAENVKHEFFGFGPSAGIEARWKPREKLTVVGECSGALLYGVWNVEDNFRRTTDGLPSPSYEAFSTRMNDSRLGTVTLRSFLGIEWRVPCPMDVQLRAGYEVQWWANQQRLLTFQQLPMHGDLTFQGGTCGLAVSY